MRKYNVSMMMNMCCEMTMCMCMNMVDFCVHYDT